MSARAIVCLLALLPVGTLVAAQTEPATATEVAAPEPAVADRLQAAEEKLLEAELEQAEELAGAIIDELRGVATDPSGAAADLDLLTRALDLVAQCRYALGDQSGAIERIDEIIGLTPGFQASGDVVGPKYVQLFEDRRGKLVGYLEVACEPLPCEQVSVAGRQWPLGADGLLAVPAGSYEVTLSRHGFEDYIHSEVAVTAGERAQLAATLEQVARDLRLVTSPAGVEVRLDGVLVGTTEPGEANGVSAPLEIREVPPGLHDLVFQADCRQRVEHKLEVVIDALDPYPVDLETVTLAPAQAFIEVAWPRPEGGLLVDGSPVDSGRHSVCPGEHEVSVSLAGRRVWFEQVSLVHEETVRLTPDPRPTLALIRSDDATAERLAGESWNVVWIEAGAAADLVARLGERWGTAARSVPLFPRHERGEDEAAGRLARALAPEAGLVAVWLEVRDSLRPTRRLVLLDPDRGLVEATAWPLGAGGAAAPEQVSEQARELLAVDAPPLVSFLGIDPAARRRGPVVVAAVHPGGPAAAAGVEAGVELLALGGEPVVTVGDYYRILAIHPPGTEIKLRVGTGAAEPIELTATVQPNVDAPNPAGLTEGHLLPALISAEAARYSGNDGAILSGAVRAGLILAALGRTRDAAGILDRTSIDEQLDRSEDARGTILMVLERLLADLGFQDEAAAVRVRWSLLPEARFGGRRGPPLRYRQVGAGN